MIGTDYYPLTEVCRSSEDFYAAQFHDPASGMGILHLINNVNAKETDFTIQLKALDPDVTYVLNSYEHKKELHLTGAALLQQFHISMNAKSGDVWFYKPM